MNERRSDDREIGMIISKIDGIEKKMDMFMADFKHNCELKHAALDEYIREATDKVPTTNCNSRMQDTEKVVSRHSVYWGIFLTLLGITAIPLAVHFIEKIFVR